MSLASRAFLARWAESALTGAAAAALLWKGADLALWSGWFGWWLGWLLIVGGVGAALWCLAAIQRARVAGRDDGPGMVVIEERRIGFYGPHGGGFVDIDELDRIELVGTADRIWLLQPRNAPPLAIPRAAAGADGLVDAMTALPGFSAAAAAEALATPGRRPLTIWRRPRPALARPGTPA